MLYHGLTCEPNQLYMCRKLMTSCRSVNRVNSEVASKKKQSLLQRLFSVRNDRDRIAGWGNDLDCVLVVLFNVRPWNMTKPPFGYEDKGDGIKYVCCHLGG